MRKIWPCVLLSLLSLTARAGDHDDLHWKLAMEGGLNTDGWEWEASISYFPVENVGVKCAFGIAGEIGELYGYGWDDYYYYESDYACRFKFMPSLEMKTPPLIRWESQSSTFHLFVNPGVSMSPGARGSCDAQWFNWFVKSGIEVDFGPFNCRLGYGFTNYDLYSGNPYSDSGLSESTTRIAHSGFFAVGMMF